MPATQLKIDLVSDVACPWCAVGLASLQKARETLAGEIDIELHFQPFELNPDMAPEGEDRAEHITKKFNMSEAQRAQNWHNIQARGAELGFTFSDAPTCASTTPSTPTACCTGPARWARPGSLHSSKPCSRRISRMA